MSLIQHMLSRMAWKRSSVRSRSGPPNKSNKINGFSHDFFYTDCCKQSVPAYFVRIVLFKSIRLLRDVALGLFRALEKTSPPSDQRSSDCENTLPKERPLRIRPSSSPPPLIPPQEAFSVRGDAGRIMRLQAQPCFGSFGPLAPR